MQTTTRFRHVGTAGLVCMLMVTLIGCSTTAPPPAEPIAIDEVAAPTAMPEPKPALELQERAAQWVETTTQAALDRYTNTPLNEGHRRQADAITALLNGTYEWQRPSEPRFDYDPAMLWAVCIEIEEDPGATKRLKAKAQKIISSLLAEQAVRDKVYAVARVLMAQNLLIGLEEDPAGEHAHRHPKAFMLMGDHAGLCQWYRWHLVQRQHSSLNHPHQPATIVRINEDLAPKWVRLARMENDPRALKAWARVALDPDAAWIEGANLGYVSQDPDAYQNRWREAWQAWAFDAPLARQRRTQDAYLAAVEQGWREKVVFKINANSDRPHQLKNASEEEFERCFRIMRNRCPRWDIRSWGKGPFDADRARASQQALKAAWAHWHDTFIDDDPVADVAAYLGVQSLLLAHLGDLNRDDGYREETAERIAFRRRFLTFEFDWLLGYERDRRHDTVVAKSKIMDEARRDALLREHAHAQALQAARLAGDVQRVLDLERAERREAIAKTDTANKSEAELHLAGADAAARDLDTEAFVESFDRYLRLQSPPRAFYPWHYR